MKGLGAFPLLKIVNCGEGAAKAKGRQNWEEREAVPLATDL